MLNKTNYSINWLWNKSFLWQKMICKNISCLNINKNSRIKVSKNHCFLHNFFIFYKTYVSYREFYFLSTEWFLHNFFLFSTKHVSYRELHFLSTECFLHKFFISYKNVSYREFYFILTEWISLQYFYNFSYLIFYVLRSVVFLYVGNMFFQNLCFLRNILSSS